MDDADALIAQASDLVEGLSEGAGTPPPPPPGTDTGAAHNNTVEVGSVPLATLPSSALPSALPTSDAGRTLPPSSAPTITPLPVPVSDVAVVEAAAPAHNPDDSSDDEELKAPDTGLVLVPDNVADKPLDEHPGLVPLVPGHEAPCCNGIVYGFDVDDLSFKPWRQEGCDVHDYFNYGFNEELWRAHCLLQPRGKEAYENRAIEQQKKAKRHAKQQRDAAKRKRSPERDTLPTVQAAQAAENASTALIQRLIASRSAGNLPPSSTGTPPPTSSSTQPNLLAALGAPIPAGLATNNNNNNNNSNNNNNNNTLLNTNFQALLNQTGEPPNKMPRTEEPGKNDNSNQNQNLADMLRLRGAPAFGGNFNNTNVIGDRKGGKGGFKGGKGGKGGGNFEMPQQPMFPTNPLGGNFQAPPPMGVPGLGAGLPAPGVGGEAGAPGMGVTAGAMQSLMNLLTGAGGGVGNMGAGGGANPPLPGGPMPMGNMPNMPNMPNLSNMPNIANLPNLLPGNLPMPMGNTLSNPPLPAFPNFLGNRNNTNM